MSDRASIYWQPEWEASRGVRGSDVERVTGQELVHAMRTNVAEAMANLERARTNLHRARAAGRIVVDAETRTLRATTVGEGRHAKPDPLAQVAISDWLRALAELEHWQSYLDWAKDERTAVTLPDRRLPSEPEELEEAPF